MPALHLATFTVDVTPPLGHPLCGGWIEPARGVDDPLRAVGVVLLGMGQPVVLCAVDWCGLRNDAHWVWRDALAAAAHTVPDHVALQTVHPHDTPFADLGAEEIAARVPGVPAGLDRKFYDRVVKQSADAVQVALARTRRFTHVGTGKGRVEQVASNRRVIGPDGKVKFWRASATRNKEARAEPEGLIDPWLRTLSFWDGDRPLAALHYYATHPMSHYGQGMVSADFCGLARQKMQDRHPGVHQVYFTGCAGNIAAGKYNDGTPANRVALRDRIFAGMEAAWQATERVPVKSFDWRVEPVRLPPRREAEFTEEGSRTILEDPKETKGHRKNAAFRIAWRRRLDRPINVTCLDLGPALVAHLPGEPFIEYQLKAQSLRPDRFVCVAGYGDDGCGYIPTEHAFFEGGYETTVALAGPESERILHAALAKLLKAGA